MFFGDFPFGGSGGMPGGMPGGGGMPRSKANVDNSKFYDLLGVSKDADTTTIKKAYRKLALAHHPDRGGDAEKFKDISKAHEVLSDPEKRKVYDMAGEEGLDGSSSGGPDPSDIFSAMFGGGGRGGERQRVRRGEDVVHTMSVPLSQLYTGATKKMALNREVLCKGCNGTGGKDGKTVTCGGCGGKGRRVVMQRMGMMVAQQVVTCPECRGKGSSISESDKCTGCKGAQIVKEREVLTVEIEKGMRNNQKVTFRGKGDEKPDHETGDVVFIVNEETHPVFKRVGEHLVIEKKVTLLEALTGFKFFVDHLDGRKLLIHSTPGVVYKPGDQVIVKGEGMPVHGRSHVKGHLVVTVAVDFPKTISPDDAALLSKALPKAPALKLPAKESDYEEHYLESAGNIDLSGKNSRGKAAYDEDDEEDEEHHGHGPQVGCQQA